jgi:hypothetical protein
VADRVVRDRRQVDHGVEADEVLGGRVADVTGPLFVVHGGSPEVAPVVPAGVETDDLMSGGLQDRHHDGADVAAVARDKDLHGMNSF